MGKLTMLLNEATIINVKLLSKAMLRCRVQCALILSVVLILLLGLYFCRPIVYSVSLPFKTFVKHVVSSDLASIEPARNNLSMNLSELNASLSNYSFLKLYASNVALSPFFPNLHFRTMEFGKDIKGAEVLRNCNLSKECTNNKLASLLRGSYAIEKSLTDDRFILTIKSFDKFTVKVLKEIMAKTVEQQRISFLNSLIAGELLSLKNLIDESHSNIFTANGKSVLDSFENIEAKINEIMERQKTLRFAINSEMIELSAEFPQSVPA